jgi:uncharacterized membrane protein HdeD (DUF308 family)
MTNTVLDDLHRIGRRMWWALLLRGLLALAVGLFIIARPLDSIAAFALVIAFWALFTGIVNIVHAFDVRPMRHWWVLLLSGLVSLGFGIVALKYYPVPSLAFAVIWASWWLLFTGLVELFAAFQMKDLGESWGWIALFGVLSTVAGVFALLSPPTTLRAIMWLIAGFGIVVGVVLVVGAFRVRVLVRA